MSTSMTEGTGLRPATEWVPVDACTLPTTEQPLRVAEFDDLFATALREIRRPDAGAAQVRLVLAGDDALPARVQRLADAETACCSFFTFTLTRLDPEVVRRPGEAVVALDIAVPAARAAVLDALVHRASTARQATS